MTAPKPPTPDDIKAQYGFVAALANAIPEISGLLQQAVAQQWTADRFSMAVANTNWWKSTPDTVRNWMVTNISDPATAARQMRDGQDKIKQLAGVQGFGQVSDADAQSIWITSQLNNYDQAETDSYVAQRLEGSVANMPDVGGSYGSLLTQARQMAADYGYSPPDLENEVHTWVNAAANVDNYAQTGLAGWQSKMMNYAKVKYAPYADQIAQGQTVADISKPYADAYQTTLEQPASKGLDDPLIQKALQGTPDAKGQTQATPLWQFQQQLRSDPRWAETNNAKQSMAQAVTQIGKTFGFMG